jgi:uncharacterized protein with HEPN domain
LKVPPSLGDRLEHILEAIASIELLLHTTTAEAIATTRAHRMLLERELEIICEASHHVPSAIKARETSIDWRGMTDLGNLLRHAYHRVQIEILIDIARNQLPPLKAFVERVLAEEGKQ